MGSSDFDRQKNRKALAWTLGVHGILLLALIFLGFTSAPPLPDQDLGMEINLGNGTQGTGQEQPLNPNPASLTSAKPMVSHSSPAPEHQYSQPTQNIATQDNVDAPYFKRTHTPVKNARFSKNLEEKARRIRKHPVPLHVPVQPRPTPPRPKALYSGGSAHQSNSGNNAGASNDSRTEGLTGKLGDQGAVNGNPNATNHNGLFSGLGGNSLSYSMVGRSIVQYPSREGQFNEPGRVRMKITVDQLGNIVNFSIISADNPTISQLAKKKIKEVRFNANPDAPVEQFGEITFVFKIEK
ncbi:MAG: hypothetical protein ACYCOO_09330 [Chitinophagaceae bacterium]